MTEAQQWLWDCIASELRWQRTLRALRRIECEMRRARAFLKPRQGEEAKP